MSPRRSDLLAAGADARSANLFGATPLMLAAARGDAALIRLLLDAGVDPQLSPMMKARLH